MITRSIAFFGHRNVVLSEEQIFRLKSIIEDLIVKQNVVNFLFGSRSDFDSICHQVVTELKEKYPQIVRKKYTCQSETCTLESEKAYWEDVYSKFEKRSVILLGVEEEVEHQRKYAAGRANYVERNQAMIDDSDYCLFYFDEKYQPEKRKSSKYSISSYQPKSGTALAFKYAQQKKKAIINLATLA